MPYTSSKIPIQQTQYDRRIKLTEQDKRAIREKYHMAIILKRNGKLHKSVSQRSLAKEYGVSRRLIVFTLYPERRKDNYEKRVNRGGSMQYYDKNRNTTAQKNTRNYKQKLYIEGKINL